MNAVVTWEETTPEYFATHKMPGILGTGRTLRSALLNAVDSLPETPTAGKVESMLFQLGSELAHPFTIDSEIIHGAEWFFCVAICAS